MSAVTELTMATILRPYLADAGIPLHLYSQLLIYLNLLVKWNNRTNLTSIRDENEIVRRHFGESLFLARNLPSTAKMLLDYGSGAGFPGLPVKLLRPNLQVVLAESQGKKASFLREAVRTLELENIEVWPHRVEEMAVDRVFDVVTMRAVDKMEEAVMNARQRILSGGTLAMLVSSTHEGILVPGGHGVRLQLQRC